MIRTDVRLGWKSIPGHRHLVEGRENEDAVLTSQEHPYFDALMIVADGMGGHPEPRRASETAAAAARDFLFQPARLDELAERRADAAALLRRAVEYANAHVRRLAALPRASPHYAPAAAPASMPSGDKPPGCTLTVAAVADGWLHVAHVGDGSVFLLRDQRLRPLAGGEARRFGSRPEEFLGRADQVEIETFADTARAGDRLLLCTDGLTRYFGGAPAAAGSSSLQRLQQVIARPTADPQALASQLTADGRGDQYEDDTTVAIAEIGASRDVPVPSAPRGSERPKGRGNIASSRRRDVANSPLLLLPLLLTLATLGWIGWRGWRGGSGAEPPTLHPFIAPAVDLSGLPRGGVLLAQPETGRLFVLRARPLPVPAADDPLTLRQLSLLPGKHVVDTGNSFRLDLARQRLTDPKGRVYPVTVDPTTGVIEIQQAGVLRIEVQPPGQRVLIDGFLAGRTPLHFPVRAGRHQVQVRGHSSVLLDQAVEVAPNVTVALSGNPAASMSRRSGQP